jgi:S-DNA-T family DNA segregation ATPase FtsK/SpoIIIE
MWQTGTVSIVVVPSEPPLAPEAQAQTVSLPALPQPRGRGASGAAVGLLASLGGFTMLGFVAHAAPWLVALSVAGGLAGVAGVVGRVREQRRAAREVQRRRDRWQALAEGAIEQAWAGAEQQHQHLVSHHPDIAGLVQRSAGLAPGRFWSSGWTVRTGSHAAGSPVLIEPPAADQLSDPDPLLVGLLSRVPAAVVQQPRIVELSPGVPLTCSRAVARRVVAELAVARAPESWALILLGAGWQPLHWLPAAWDPDHLGGLRQALDPGQLQRQLVQAPAERLILVDHPQARQWSTGLLAERVLLVEPADPDGPDGMDGMDGMDTGTFERLLRLLAPLRTECSRSPGRSATMASLGPQQAPMSLSLGRAGDGSVVTLDLREAAEGGQGPHGLVVGATGSGKSELLRALICQLAQRHGPDELALLLIDHKGGAALQELSRLPQVAGLVTNLASADDAARVRSSLCSEVQRRQLVLREAGVESREALVATGAHLPRLVVVIDEFGELLDTDPDLLEVLVRIGRLGRSLGIHLVLSSQRVEEGRLRGLESHLRWRVCLRTFSTGESRAVLGVPDAGLLPPVPGPGFLHVDGTLTRLQAVWSSAPAVTPLPPPYIVLGAPPQPAEPVPTEREVCIAEVRARHPVPVSPVCLPPLDEVISAPDGPGVLRLDLPGQQRQPVVAVDWDEGPLAVVGGPRSGRTTALLSMAAGLLQDHPGARLALLGADLCASAWVDAGAVWTCSDPAADPEHVYAALEGLEAALSASGPPLLVLVDGVAALRACGEDVTARLIRLATHGTARGLHLALAGHRWSELGPLRELCRHRWELRTNDPGDSWHPPSRAGLLRGAPPGRVLDTDGHLGQILLRPVPPAAPASDRLLPLPQEAPLLRSGLLGVRAGDHAPVGWESELGPLLVLGERGSGRSTVLRRLAEADPRAVLLRPRDGDLPTVPRHALVLIDDVELVPGLAERLLGQGHRLAVARGLRGAGPGAWDPDLLAVRDAAAAVLVLAGDPLEGPVVSGVRARPGPPGRGTWVARGQAPVGIRCAA